MTVRPSTQPHRPLRNTTNTTTMSAFPLRCPSCDHGNPAAAKFCNNCGLPVHLQPCGNCEAINDRTANRCYKCGSPLALAPMLQPRHTALRPEQSSGVPEQPRPALDLPSPDPEALRPLAAQPNLDAEQSRPAAAQPNLNPEQSRSAAAQPRPDPDELAPATTQPNAPAIAQLNPERGQWRPAAQLNPELDPSRPALEQSVPASPLIAAISDPPPADGVLVEQRTPTPEFVEESQPHFYDPTVENSALIADAEHVGASHETSVGASHETGARYPRRPVNQDSVAPAAARSDWKLIEAEVAERRRPRWRASTAAIVAVLVVGLAVPAYLAYQDPAQFRQHFDAFTSKFDGSSPQQSTRSAPPVLDEKAASQPSDTTTAVPLPETPGTVAQPPSADVARTPQSQQPADLARESLALPSGAASESQAPAAAGTEGTQLSPTAAARETLQLPPAVAADPRLSSSETRATSRSQTARNARQSPVRSDTARSKQVNGARTVAAPRASDARARVRSSDTRRLESSEKATSRRGATRSRRLQATDFPPSEGTRATSIPETTP